jgi:hypothetical protein
MIAVVFAGVAAWLIITAVRVACDPNAEQMSHLRQYRDTGEVVVQSYPIRGVFWPRYWRRLVGRPWPGSYACPSCRERYERSENRRLIDLASSDNGSEILQAMARINEEREEAKMKALLERAGR